MKSLGSELRAARSRARWKYVGRLLRRLGLPMGDPARKAARLIAKSGLFDRDWYLAQYRDVAAARADPALHYVQHGAAEGRDPGPAFSTRWYLETYPDVAGSGMNPLVHYLLHGETEGRDAVPSRAPARPPQALPRISAIEPAAAAAPLSFPSASPPAFTWTRQAQIAPRTGEAPPAVAAALAAFGRLAGQRSPLDAAPLPCPILAVQDAWYAGDRDLRLRLQHPQRCVARLFQPDLRHGGGLAMVAEAPLEAGAMSFVDVALASPLAPLLAIFAAPDGRVLSASVLPFPSLCRGGMHYAELCALGNGAGYVENLASASAALLRGLLEESEGAFSVGRVEVELEGATGAERIFCPDVQEWLAGIMRVAVRCAPRAEGSDHPASARAYLEAAIAVAAGEESIERERRGSLALRLPADAVPALHALAARRESTPGACSFVLADDATASPRFSVKTPPIAETLLPLQPRGAALAFPFATAIAGDADRGGMEDMPLAVRFADARAIHPASLVMPVAPDATGPLLRSAPRAGTRSSVSVVLSAASASSPALAALLDSLRLQTLAALEVLAEDAAAAAAGELVLVVGAGVALHDPRTLETLAAMAGHERVASAGCVLLQADPQHAERPRLAPAARDPMEVFGTATYPVQSASRALFMAPAQLWRRLGAGAGYARAASERGYLHLCTSAVTAELRDPGLHEPESGAAPAAAASLIAALKA